MERKDKMNLDGIIEDYPNTTSLLNKATFTNLANAILDKICPVGKTEIFYDNEDHSDYLGFTWERTSVGRAIVGIDETQTEFNEIGKTGGAKMHTLTVAELASHNHVISYPNESGGDTAAIAQVGIGATPKTWGAEMTKTQVSGGGIAHNNLPPYEIFAIWKRVA